MILPFFNHSASQFIYESAPFPSCHASTIVQAKDGHIVAAWFAGKHESAPDVAIYLSHFDGARWSTPEKVADGVVPGDRSYACYNPVLFQPKKGPLLLFYKVGTGPQTWWGMMTESTDNGRHWAKPWRLPENIFGPIKNKPIELPDGTLLCGSSEEIGSWRLHFETTKDFGRTWWRTSAIDPPFTLGAIQPTILPLGGKRLRAVGRTQQGKLFAIDSPDLGHSWKDLRLLDVKNPNSGTDAVKLKDGRYLLVFNDTDSGRSPLNVAVSKDAEHWKTVLSLETQPGEYSYPAIIQSSDGTIHITYTWKREKIRHVMLKPSEIPYDMRN